MLAGSENIRRLGHKIKRVLLEENHARTQATGQRVQNLDALKLMSLVLVLCLHCSMSYDDYHPAGTVWSVTRFVYNIGVLAVPMFFTVSGYQLLGREKAGYGYAVRKVLNLLRATFVFYLFVKALLWLFWNEPFVVSQLPRQFFLSLLQRGDYWVIWFMGGMGLIYLCYPLVNRIYVNHKRGFCLFYAACLLLQTFIFTMTIIRPTAFFLNEYNVAQTFRLWNWLGYFCLGGLVKRYHVFSLAGRLSYVVAMAVCCFVFLNFLTIKRDMWWCEYGYGSLPVILFVVVVFSYVMKFKMKSRFLEEVAVVFFPAYLLGNIFIAILTDKMVGLPEEIGAIVFVAAVALCSVTSGWLLMQIPLVRRLLKL